MKALKFPKMLRRYSGDMEKTYYKTVIQDLVQADPREVSQVYESSSGQNDWCCLSDTWYISQTWILRSDSKQAEVWKCTLTVLWITSSIYWCKNSLLSWILQPNSTAVSLKQGLIVWTVQMTDGITSWLIKTRTTWMLTSADQSVYQFAADP